MADQVITVQKLIDADKDATSLDTFISGTDSATVTTRKGRTYPSLAKAVKQVMETGGFEPFATEVALKASVPTISKKAAKALDTKKVWLWDGTKWNDTGLSELDLAKNYIDSFDEIRLNKGKTYPFKQVTRDGVTSIASTVWNNFILDVRVNNADPSKYYQIAYQQNGTLLSNDNNYDWLIYEFDKSTFLGASTPVIVVDYKDAGQTQIKPDGTIQTITVNSLVRSRLSFTITCDTSALPSNNAPISSISAGNPGWSFIIDPSCYYLEDTKLITLDLAPRSWLYNKGQYYPFVKSTFKSVSSVLNTVFMDVIKDIQVVNAEEGFLYSLGYYTNGSTSLGANYQERWLIYKRPKVGYSETTATETQIVALAIPQETLNKSGNVEKIRIVSSGAEYFYITVDTSKLPAYGTYINAASLSYAGYSWYITPVNYTPKIASIDNVSNLNCYFEYSASTKSFKYRYISKSKAYEIVFGVNGANNLPNFKSISISNSASLIGDFSTVQSFATDWLPPLIFYAVNGDAEGGTGSFTGGNHASNGDASGDPTAENEIFSIFIDGRLLNMQADLSGYCGLVEVKIVNKIMASNTRVSKRYALRQIFELEFKGSAINVHCRLKALEDIKLRSDYALQMTTSGFNDTQLILSGRDITRIAFDPTLGSGNRVDYPNAWAVIMKSNNGILASWVDRSYGDCKPENCAPDQSLVRGGGVGSIKYYHCAFRSFGSELNGFPELNLNQSSEYKWRGGYVIQADNSDAVYDSILKLKDLTSIVDANTYY